jgi:hypothetical protein
MQVLLHDHLAFGVRLERVTILVDGGSAYEATQLKAPLELADLSVAAGAHTVAVLAEVSQPCGLFDEPRMRVSVRAVQTFLVGEGPATLDVDLFPGAATSDPAHMVSVRFAGERITLGTKAEGDALPRGARCEVGDEVCALDARIDGARARGDVRKSACYAARRDDVRHWRELLEDSFSAVSREGATARDAEDAQLRARYAESRLRASVAEAGACGSDAPVRAEPVEIERKVVAVCATPDVTAQAL